jgi:hypothetical protein
VGGVLYGQTVSDGRSGAALELVMHNNHNGRDGYSLDGLLPLRPDDDADCAGKAAAAAAAGGWREVILSYLPRGTNRALFHTFGFTERGNPHDNLPWWALEPLWTLWGAGTQLDRTRLLRAAGLVEGEEVEGDTLRFVDVGAADEMGDEQAERAVTAARGLLELAPAAAAATRGMAAAAGVAFLAVLEAALAAGASTCPLLTST